MSKQEIWALVPLKGGVEAKQRLSSVLTQAQRQQLLRAMATDVLQSLLLAQRVAGVLVVCAYSDTDDYGWLPKECEVLTDPPNSDLNGALQYAMKCLAAKGGIETMMIVHGDLPLMRSHHVDALLDYHNGMPSGVNSGKITLVADVASEGTNCLVSTPYNVLPRLYFGEDSLRLHRLMAGQQCITSTQYPLATIALDIDRADDLKKVARQLMAMETNTAVCLRQIGEITLE